MANAIEQVKAKDTERECRFGLMSRIDFPSEGFRLSLIEKAAEDFRREDVHFPVLAGGLIDGRYVKKKIAKLNKLIRRAEKAIKELKKPVNPKVLKKNAAQIAEIEARIERYYDYLEELEPEKMASQLAKLIPVFKNAKGETLKLYIIPSPAFDDEIGETVAQILAEKRPDDVRVYKTGGDRLYLKQANKYVDVLVPVKAVWMRSDYASTPVERVLKDKRRQTSREMPDLYAVGCFGSTITKPAGETPRPYVSAPVLCRLSEVRVNENQVGVRVIAVSRDQSDPIAKNFSYKDLVQDERSFIALPKRQQPKREKILAAIKDFGKMAPGLIADRTGLARATVEAELSELSNKNGKRPPNWPGIRFFREAKQYDFDAYWVRENLKYPSMPTDCKEDVVVGVGCPHIGSIYTDYRFMQTAIPKMVLENRAGYIAWAGDLVEGIKHGMLVRGEVFGGLNVTSQEILAGLFMAGIVNAVFDVRFEEARAALPSGADQSQIAAAVDASIVVSLMIAGNHDAWALEFGFTPLVLLKLVMGNSIAEHVSTKLTAKGLTPPPLTAMIKNKIVEPLDGDFTLPSGLKLHMGHPYMSRTKTHSIRAQEQMDFASDAHLVIGANYHVGMHIEMWDGELGQRVGLQLGTLKRASDFENNKLKTVDHGIGYVKVRSFEGRIVATESSFFTNPPTKNSVLDRQKVFKDFLNNFGLVTDVI